MSLALYYVTALAGSAVLFWFLGLPSRRKGAMLPPGPPGDPVLGHLRYMPSARPALVFHEWAKNYGDVMHLQVLGRSMIILDTYQAAVDLLDKRGVNYSGRPNYTLYELLGWTPSLTFLQYGKQWAKHRQMHHSYLNRHNAENFKPLQILEARTLMRNLVQCAPDKYESYLSRFATGVVTQIVAGHRITSDDDSFLHMSRIISEAMGKMGPPRSSPLDFFPVLRYFPSWFPGASHVGIAKRWRPTVRELHDYPVRTVKKQKETGTAAPSFILAQLEEMGDDEDENDLKGAAATMFGAGEATTWTALTVFILAMILYPECQIKAQMEIDSVVGDLRLPEFEDRDNLPFVECILHEVLRWNPGLPLGVPHRAMEDDIYRGMLIPKGSLVLPNIKAMSLDETTYSDPTSFYPERYLPQPAGNGEPHFDHIAFGFGRRVCTGRYVADNSIWIVIATFLASCTVTNVMDDDGKIVVPENAIGDGVGSHARGIRCVISPRSLHARALILDASV
ncbi:cytochrome P450 [Mycena latifolia]|nr:cytochrome P450 [Mycena latifolia]